MGIDAGSVSSSVRIKLADLERDIAAVKTAHDVLGAELATNAAKYSNVVGKQYTTALKSIAKETKNVEAATKAGALTESEGIQRLIDLRKSELQVLQKRAISEGGANKATITAIQNTQQGITVLTEKQKTLQTETTKTSSAFTKLSGILGAVGVGVSAAAVINYLKQTIAEAAEAENSWTLLDRALQLKGMQSAKAGLADLANQLQKVAGIDGDYVAKLEAGLVAQGRSEGQIKQLIKAAAGLSAVTGDDLGTSLDQLNKTLDGMPPRVTELKTLTDGLTESQLRNGEGVQRALAAYEGYIGKGGELKTELAKMKEAFSDINETVGGEAGKGIKAASPIIIELLQSFQRLIPTLSSAYQHFINMEGAWSALGFIFGPITAAIKGFGGALQIISSLMRGDIPGATNRLGKTILDVIDGLLDPTKNFINWIIGGINKGIEAINKLRAVAGKKPIKLIEEFDFWGLTDKIDNLKEKLDSAYEVIRSGGKDLVAASDAYKKALDKIENAETKHQINQKAATEQKIAATEKYIKSLEGIKDKNWQIDEQLQQARETLAALNKERENPKPEKQALSDAEALKKYADELKKLEQRFREVGASEAEITKLRREAEVQAIRDSDMTLEQKAKEIGLLYQIYDAEDKLKSQNANKALAESAKDYAAKLDALNGKIKNTVEEERKKALDTIKNSGASAEAMEDAEAAVNAYFDALAESKDVEEFNKNAEKIIGKVKTVASAAGQLMGAILEGVGASISRASKTLLDELQADYEAMSDAAEEARERMREQDQEYYDEQNALLDEQYELKKELIENDGITKMESLQKQLADAVAANDTERASDLQKQIALINLENEYLAQKQAAEDAFRLDQESKETAYLAAKEQREKDYETRKAQLEYEAALSSWRITVANAISGAAIAVINGLATKPFIPAGIAAGILAGTLGAVQIANAAGAKPQPPALATGGIVLPRAGGMDVKVAEKGSAELILGGGAEGKALLEQFAAPIAEIVAARVGGSSGGVTKIIVPVYLDGKVIAQSTADYFNNGKVRVTR